LFKSSKLYGVVLSRGIRVPIIFSSVSLFIGTFLSIISFFFISFIDLSTFFSEADDIFYVVSKDTKLIHTINKEKLYFTDEDLNQLKNLNGVKNVSKIYTSKFPSRIYISGLANFYSEIFLEAIDNEFLSVDTTNFNWNQNQKRLPLIISNEFLHLYNYSFSGANNLPVLTTESAKFIPLKIEIGSKLGSLEVYSAKVHDFSDRYLSILVPKNFMIWANNIFADEKNKNSKSTKIIVEVDRKEFTDFITLIDDKNYIVQNNKIGISENLKLLNYSLGLLLLISIGILLISFFFIYLANMILIEKEQKNIQKLQLIGYSIREIQFYIFKQSFVGIFIAIAFSIIISIIGLVQITELMNNFIILDNFKIRLFIILFVILALSIIIIYFSNLYIIKNIKKNHKTSFIS